MLPKSVAKRLISGLRCANCLKDFDENSIQTMRFDDELFVLKITCNHCFKSFGLAFLGLCEGEITRSFAVGDNKKPISFDDVIDAHKYIQNLDENWKNFIQKFDTK